MNSQLFFHKALAYMAYYLAVVQATGRCAAHQKNAAHYAAGTPSADSGPAGCHSQPSHQPCWSGILLNISLHFERLDQLDKGDKPVAVVVMKITMFMLTSVIASNSSLNAVTNAEVQVAHAIQMQLRNNPKGIKYDTNYSMHASKSINQKDLQALVFDNMGKPTTVNHLVQTS